MRVGRSALGVPCIIVFSIIYEICEFLKINDMLLFIGCHKLDAHANIHIMILVNSLQPCHSVTRVDKSECLWWY